MSVYYIFVTFISSTGNGGEVAGKSDYSTYHKNESQILSFDAEWSGLMGGGGVGKGLVGMRPKFVKIFNLPLFCKAITM